MYECNQVNINKSVKSWVDAFVLLEFHSPGNENASLFDVIVEIVAYELFSVMLNISFKWFLMNKLLFNNVPYKNNHCQVDIFTTLPM